MTRHTLHLVRLAMFLALTAVIQVAGFPQPITGPLINAVLLSVGLILGPFQAILIGVLTPVAALIRGQLPPLLAPMVPFIGLANAAWIGVFLTCHAFSKTLVSRRGIGDFPIFRLVGDFAGVFMAATVKFFFLTLSVRWVLPVFLGKEIPPVSAAMMTTPQWFTAMAGGVLAVFLFYSLSGRGAMIKDHPS